MFAWFQRLLPHSGDFYSMFERHSVSTLAAAVALDSMARGLADPATAVRTIRDREHDADEVIREVLHAVRRTFLTPFDRGAITSLINAMDDVIDEMQSVANAVEMYEVSSFEPQMQEITAITLEAARLIVEAVPLLRDVARNGHRLHELTAQLVALEGKVDVLYGSGMKAHFQKARDGAKTLDFLVAREIYKQLERVADAFEDVAIEIDTLVIDHA